MPGNIAFILPLVTNICCDSPSILQTKKKNRSRNTMASATDYRRMGFLNTSETKSQSSFWIHVVRRQRYDAVADAILVSLYLLCRLLAPFEILFFALFFFSLSPLFILLLFFLFISFNFLIVVGIHVGECSVKAQENRFGCEQKYLYRDGKRKWENEKRKADEKSPTDMFIKEATETAHINGICM